MFSALFLVVLLVWAVFYLIVSRQIYAQAETRIDLAANQVMDQLGAELAELEQVSHMLSGSPALLQFAQETDTSAYYLLADRVGGLIENTRINTEFVDHIIVFGANGAFFRFSGRLSNTSCTRIGHLAGRMAAPDHLAVRLGYQNYIGYVSLITDGAGSRRGALVMLVEEEKLLELIRQSAMGESLLVAVLGGGEVVASNTADVAGGTSSTRPPGTSDSHRSKSRCRRRSAC